MNDAKVLVRFKGDTKNLDDATGKAKKGLQSFKSVAAGIGKGVAAGVAVAATTATAALIDISKQSLQARADLEQLAGGSKLLFGEAADYIEEKSKAAYKAAGMSANQYLQQVNGFAVGLKNSLGGNEKAAAELADKIITAEADIVAATGNSQEAVQNAFNGIMKGNYTMLDNLQLGIKPTKAGMQEVINKVNEWNKAQGHATKYQMDNYADMQSAIVDYVKMQGLAGYAANEATSTITGSISATKAAWGNFLAGTGSAKEVVDMVVNTAKNISKELLKIIPDIANGLIDLINGLLPMIPPMIQKLLPVLVQGIMTLTQSLLKMLPELITQLVKMLADVVNALADALPTLIPTLIDAIIDGLLSLLDNIDLLIDCGINLLIGLATGIISAIPKLIEKIPIIIEKLISAIIRNLPRLVLTGGKFIPELVKGIMKTTGSFFALAPKLVKGIANGLTKGVSQMFSVGKNLLKGLWNGVSSAKNYVLSKISGVGNAILKKIRDIFKIGSPSKVMFEIGGFIDQGFINGIDSMKTDIQKAIDGTFSLSPNVTNSASTHFSPNVNVINNIEMKQDPLGQMVNNIKTFSGGAKNDYNYGKA